MNCDLAVLIMGYDGYFPAWKINAQYFLKYWKNCPFNIYFSTGEREAPFPFKTIKCGRDKDYCSRAKLALSKIPEKYIILLQDDYFIIHQPDNEKLLLLSCFMEKNEAFCLRLSPYPCAKTNEICFSGIRMGQIQPGGLYSVNVQASIWNRSKFAKFIEKYSTVWDIEYLGSKDCNSSEKIYCLDRKNAKEIYQDIGTEGAIQAGKWTRKFAKRAKQEGINLPKEIEVESLHYYLWKKLKCTLLMPLFLLLKKTPLYSLYRKKRYQKVLARETKEKE